MRQLFTCLVVVLLFAAALSPLFTANHRLPEYRQAFGYSPSPASYTDYSGQKPHSPAQRVRSSQIVQRSTFLIPFRLSDPIA